MFAKVALLLSIAVAARGQENKRVLAITAQCGDYLVGGGGTIASLAGRGYEVTVIQVTNDEKNSLDLGPAETSKANMDEGRQAAKVLGAREVLFLGHKAGELGYISSTELRQELFGLIRYFKPRILFIPDPYLHYDENRDRFYAGKAAEEAWGYSGGGTFSPDLNRMGIRPYGAPEIYYYAAQRPYRPGEGGDEKAQFRPVDITAVFEKKLEAILTLKTTNRVYASRTSRKTSPDDFMRAYVEELASTIGRKHGFRYGEEFNYVGVEEGLPAHVKQRAVKKQ